MVNGTRHGFGSLLVPGPSGQTITYTGQWNQVARRPIRRKACCSVASRCPTPRGVRRLSPASDHQLSTQGVRHGTGKITYDDAESRWYEVSKRWGLFSERMHTSARSAGQQADYFPYTETHQGSWKDDLREGHGEMHYASGAHYKVRQHRDASPHPPFAFASPLVSRPVPAARLKPPP